MEGKTFEVGDGQTRLIDPDLIAKARQRWADAVQQSIEATSFFKPRFFKPRESTTTSFIPIEKDPSLKPNEWYFGY